MLLVGEPEAGKTTLSKKLTLPNYRVEMGKEDSTEGIEIIHWQCAHPQFKEKKLAIKIWDFGGQEIQYLTHQFFLSTDALYILLTSSRLNFIRDEQVAQIFDKVIVATGGTPKKSGLEWLENLGHEIENPVPSLFTFNMPDEEVVRLIFTGK